MYRKNIDRGWTFHRGTVNPMRPTNDSKIVDLPHDFTIETDPYPDAPGGPATGYYGGGIGTYTKILEIPENLGDKRILVEFDGVYMNAVVDLNGHIVSNHHYGYTPFHVDLTPYIYTGKPNRLTVIANNSAQPNSRWYTGSGIYRHVDLLFAPLVHIAPWGIFTRTSHIVNGRDAYIIVETTVENHSSKTADRWIDVTVQKESCGTEVGKSRTKVVVPAGEKSIGRVMIKVENADIWDIDSPSLYTITSKLTDGQNILDEESTTFGIRTISVDPDNGFMLNGKTLKLKGGCVHHDNGILGAASFYDSEFRKMKLHKDNGYNAIRCAHNPPSRDMLDACDRLGLLVMNEAFDTWTISKNVNDYSLYFKENWKADMEAFILRDRNHPSIVFWSTGNEIVERAGLSDGYRLAFELAEFVRQLDPTRAVTNGVCSLWSGLDDEKNKEMQEEMRKIREKGGSGLQNFDSSYTEKIWGELTEAFISPLDVTGYNYLDKRYEADGKQYPGRIICGTESFPKEIDRVWNEVERLSHVIGDFTWTSHDYIGEAGIGKVAYVEQDSDITPIQLMSHGSPFPWRLANDADLDICGFERPQLAYRRIVWGSDETYIAIRHPATHGKKEVVSMWGWPEREKSWNWQGFEGRPIEVDVYSAADEVELVLNGRSLGKKPAGKANRYTATFELTYEPGTLEAFSYSAGKKVSASRISTSGKPEGLRIKVETVDRHENTLKLHKEGTIHLPSNGQSLAFATVEIVDADGNLVPNAEINVTAKVEGAATLAALGSSNPQTIENYTTGSFTSYQGRLLAIIRTGFEPGPATLTVDAEGLKQAIAKFEIE
jgi:beta-galactosidase